MRRDSTLRAATVEIYATADELSRLHALGYAVVEADVKTHEAEITGYHTYEQMTAVLQDFAARYPSITRLTSLGPSVEGRELWALLITDNPDIEEAEPEFKYIATMHGDEPVGTEMLLLLIERLLTGYGTDTRITNLVDSTAMWFVPLMNPDGLARNSRFNAQGIDLNRSFPRYPQDFTGTWFDGEDPRLAGRPPEVRHVMNWTLENSFVLSANFHTGALLVNYPYDDDGVPSGTDAPTPDDALFREIALRYSMHNTPMYTNPAFSQGIVNGSEWFVITGSMQDWNYRYAGVNEVTLEIAVPKRPAYGLLEQYWADNEESMLSYIEAVHMGVRGIVTDSMGDPVWAEITVQGNPQPVVTDADVGDYYRMLLPGVYDLVFRADGFFTKTIADVVVVDGTPTYVDVVLLDPDIDNDGMVGATDVQLVINAALGMDVPYETDLDGGGTTATDVQKIVNAVLEW
jgi:hypothetical protein